MKKGVLIEHVNIWEEAKQSLSQFQCSYVTPSACTPFPSKPWNELRKDKLEQPVVEDL